MSNLPNSQIDDSSGINPVEPNNTTSDPTSTPTPLGTTNVERGYIPETPRPSETILPPENLQPPVPPKSVEPEKSVEETLLSVEQTTPVTEVADKTDQITTLHEIKETKDKLTEEADEEEEHFIEEVEKHHGDL